MVRVMLLVTLSVYRIAFGQDMPKVPNSLKYLEYENGRIVRETIIRKGDAIYEALVRLLSEEQTKNDWVKDVKTYVPHKYFVSDSLTVLCNRDIFVVNSRASDGKWMQVSKALKDCEGKLSVY